ncbi:hypothetical protein CR513_33059, partial [Mucuna pruriens]
MKNRESVNDYFAQTLTITNKMRMYGEKVPELSIIEKILRSMTLRYNYVVCFIEESHNLDSIIVDEIQSNLLVHKQRMNGHNSHEEQALKVAQHEASTGCGEEGNSECPKKAQDSKTNYVEGGEAVLLMAQHLTDDKLNAQKMWFIDSSCNNHRTSRKD